MDNQSGNNKKPVKKWSTLRDIPHEFIVTMGSGILPTDLKLFFDIDLSKIDPQISLTHVKHFEEPISFDDLAVSLDLFPSKGEAKRNGWLGKIPQGYIQFTGKNNKGEFEFRKKSGQFKSMFFILNLPNPIKE